MVVGQFEIFRRIERSSTLPKNRNMATSKVNSKGKKLDFTGTAASVVSQAIGQDLFTSEPLLDPNEGKDPQAIERGRKGGEIGGKARALNTRTYGPPLPRRDTIVNLSVPQMSNHLGGPHPARSASHPPLTGR